MRRALMIMTALCVLLPGVSVAQTDQQKRPPAPTTRPTGPGQPVHPARPPVRPLPVRPQPPRPAPPRPHPVRPPPRPQPVRPPEAGRPGYHRPPPVYVRPLPPRGNQFWHRGQYYNRVRGPAFHYPTGWRYRQWDIGQRLPPLLRAPAYVYPEWASLGLQAPVGGYAWVRFGPDLLLINQTTGEVEDVVYGALE